MSSILTRGTFYTFFIAHFYTFFRFTLEKIFCLLINFPGILIFRLFGSACVYTWHIFGFPPFTQRRLPIIVPPCWFDRKVVRSQAEKYLVFWGELCTLQNIAVSTVIGFEKFKLEFGFKITYLRINDKRNLVPKGSEFMTNPEESNTHRSYDDE